MKVNMNVNGEAVSVDVEPDTKLLWILREHLGLVGTKFGCGVAACGACTVHLDGSRTFSCQIPASILEGKSVTTIEGLASSQSDGANEDGLHPVQEAWIEEQVPQCGYCQPGQMMAAADLLKDNPNPTREDIVQHMSTNICRCGTYPRIVKAIQLAAENMNKQG